MIYLDKLKERVKDTPDLIPPGLIEILVELDEPDENLNRIAVLEDQIATMTAAHEEALAAAAADYDARLKRLFFGEDGGPSDPVDPEPEDDPDTDDDGDVDDIDLYQILMGK